jgi:hypothetical protein
VVRISEEEVWHRPTEAVAMVRRARGGSSASPSGGEIARSNVPFRHQNGLGVGRGRRKGARL